MHSDDNFAFTQKLNAQGFWLNMCGEEEENK